MLTRQEEGGGYGIQRSEFVFLAGSSTGSSNSSPLKTLDELRALCTALQIVQSALDAQTLHHQKSFIGSAVERRRQDFTIGSRSANARIDRLRIPPSTADGNRYFRN